MGGPLIDVREVRRRFGENEVLRGVSLAVEEGEMVALTGRSGSGKSTLLSLIGGLDRDFSGQIRCCGADLAALDDRGTSRLRNESIGFVFQSFHLLDHLSCLENVRLPDVFSARPLPDGEARRRAEEVLSRVGLLERSDALPGALSGGQKQRVAIARALFSRPRLLLCDEPTGNLDVDTGAAIIELFSSLHREGMTLFLVTHEARTSAAAGRVLALKDGVLVEGQGAA